MGVMTLLMLLLMWVLLAFALAPLVGWLLRKREDSMRLRCGSCFAVLSVFGEGNIFRHTLRAHPDSELAEYLRAEVERALR